MIKRSNQFAVHVGIDYSGAATPEKRSAALQVYQSTGSRGPMEVASPAASASRRRHWNRAELAEWLLQCFSSEQRVIVALDHGFSFPCGYFQRYGLKTWQAFLEDFVEHWPTHRSGVSVEDFRQDTQRTGESREFRLTEKWTSSAKSVFQFDVNGSVAKSTHAGLPFLWQLRRQVKHKVHFWPFDGWQPPAHKSVVAETYPSLFRNRYPREDRSGDQQDAYAVCRWLEEMDSQNSLSNFFQPPLTPSQMKQASLEGWILGVQ